MPAPMPYFIEFSKCVGMHAGYLPGYPASHGCVRMPRDLAAEFFDRVKTGTPVKVIGSARNVTRVRRAIPIIQPGNSRYATAFSDPRQVPLSARNSARVKRAIPVIQPSRSQYATVFLTPGQRLNGRWDFTSMGAKNAKEIRVDTTSGRILALGTRYEPSPHRPRSLTSYHTNVGASSSPRRRTARQPGNKAGLHRSS